MSKLKLLIAEDDSRAVKLYELGLSGRFFDVRFAENGMEAIKIYQGWEPDIVVLDIIMPVMSGILALKKIRNEFKDTSTKIIMATTVNDKKTIFECMKMEIQGYILKPFDYNDIELMIKCYTQPTLSPQDQKNLLLTSPVEKSILEKCDHEAPLNFKSWKIIVVDRADEVHSSIKNFLNDFSFDGKKVELLSAFSTKEAKTIIKENNDAALILVDYEMESEDSGLHIARYVRKELDNNYVRIIIQSGLNEESIEHTILTDNAVNGYISRTELTKPKFLNAILSSLKSFRGVMNLSNYSENLKTLLEEKNRTITELSTRLDDISNVEGGEKENLLPAFNFPLKILLVEDYIHDCNIIQSFFKETAFKLHIAGNGLEGVKMFKNGDYDIVLMDMQMPVMDGYTATRKMKKLEKEMKRKETPVIALTAFESQEKMEKTMEAGCADYLAKPFEKESLLTMILNYTLPATKEAVPIRKKYAEFAEKRKRKHTESLTVRVPPGLKEFIPKFLNDVRGDIKSMAGALSSEEFESVRKIGHSLKGVGGGYGFNAITELGSAIEEAALEKNLKKIERLFKELGNYVNKVKVVYE